jgi:translocation and assembly module TamB
LNARRVTRDFHPWAAVLLALLVLLFSSLAGLWWWSGTEGSLEWVLRRIARTQPLTAEGVRGSLRSDMQVQRLAWERDGLTIEAEDVQLAWRPLWLLEGIVKLTHLRATSLRITDRRPPSEDPWRPPEALLIRPEVQVDEVTLGKVEWTAARTFSAQELAARYWFDGRTHSLRMHGVRFDGGSYRGHADLGARAPLPLDATLFGRLDAPVPAAPAKVPVQFTLRLHGPLEDLRADGSLTATGGAAGTRPMQATATARITPWEAQPVPEAHAQLDAVDAAAIWPEAPQTSLFGRVSVVPAGTDTWNVSADVRNEAPGPWDRRRLPLEQLVGQGQWRSGTALVRELDARIGGGQLRATGEWRADSDAWVLTGEVARVDPAALHTNLAAVPLSGPIDVRHEAGAFDFEVALKTLQQRARPPPRRRTPAPTVAGAARALELRQVEAKGRWAQGRLQLPRLEVRSRDALLQGSVEVEPHTQAGTGRLQLQAPGMRARVDGAISESRGAGTLHVDGTDLASAQRWLQRVPGMPAAVVAVGLDGRAQLQLTWQGGWRDPVVRAGLSAPTLEVRTGGDAGAPDPWRLEDVTAKLDGRLSDADVVLQARGHQGQRQVGLDLAGRGGRAPLQRGEAVHWRAHVSRLLVSLQDPAISAGRWLLEAQRPFDVRWSPAGQRLEASAGQAVLTAPAGSTAGTATQAVLSWDPVRWGGGELHTSGRLAGLPMGWLELVGGPQLAGTALSGDMVFDAQWDASFGRTMRLEASLVRTRGDITVLAENMQGFSSRVPAGVRDARLTLTGEGEQVTLTLRWDSERAGVAEGRLVTRLARGGAAGWQWPQSAPVEGSVRAQLPRIGVWSLLAPPGWRLRGSLDADVRVAGTRADPRLSGTLAADDLALRSVVDGIELRDGRLRAALQGNRLVVQEFRLHGAGERGGGGTLEATGEAAWVDGRPQVRATAQLTRLRASIRSDRQVTVSGNLAGRLDASGAQVNGRLRVDQARIELPEETAPRLGDDVVVRNAPGFPVREERQPGNATTTPRPLVLAVDLDLGNDFQVRGRGLQTRLRGTLAVTGRSLTQPRLVGTITTAGGEYRAYNQRLDIERGVLRFTGAIDNPALDVLAIRPNMVQRVGVQITGTAQAPFVRLYAEPDLPDAEKLAWLVTGRPAPSGGAEAALMQQAALALLSQRRGGGTGRGIAGALGLDELSVRRDTAEGAVVTLGKRFARNFYASYERSLSGALGTLYIFYDVSRRLTVRAEAGERAGVDLIFTLSFD